MLSKHEEKKPKTTPTPYLVFHTQQLKLRERKSQSKLSIKQLYHRMIESNELFKKTAAQEPPQLQLDWPHRHGNKVITLIPGEKNEKSLHFYDTAKFMTLIMNQKNELLVHYNLTNTPTWDKTDVHELTHKFNEYFQAKKISYRDEEGTLYSTIIQKNKTTLSKDNLATLINQYSTNNISYRIENVLLNHSIKNKNQYTFYLDWPDSQNHSRLLTGRFTTANTYSSHFISEKNLFATFPEYAKYKIQSEQYSYNLSLYENPADNEQTPCEDNLILSLSLMPDALYGELDGVYKGKYFSGNEVLDLYQCFDHLFKIKNTFLCDAAKLKDETGRACLKVIMPIATGKTWYETKIPGLTLFELKNFDTGKSGYLTQNRAERAISLSELQQLPLKKWHDMLDEKKKQTLLELYKNNLEKKINPSENPIKLKPKRKLAKNPNEPFNSKATIQALTAAIYHDARNKKQLTPDLAKLANLLHEDMDLPTNSTKIEKTASDYWVKSRIYQLLWESYCWIKRRPDETPDQKAETNLSMKRSSL